MARDMLPLLMNDITPQTDRHRAVLDLLKAWDGATYRTRPEPLIFALWLEKLKERVVGDDLGDEARLFGGNRPEFLRSALMTDRAWCDDQRTTGIETCAQQVAGSFSDVMVWLDENGIADVSAAHWGDFHQASFGHLLFQNFPGISRFGGRYIPSSGDNYTVNRGSSRPPPRAYPSATITGPPCGRSMISATWTSHSSPWPAANRANCCRPTTATCWKPGGMAGISPRPRRPTPPINSR